MGFASRCLGSSFLRLFGDPVRPRRLPSPCRQGSCLDARTPRFRRYGQSRSPQNPCRAPSVRRVSTSARSNRLSPSSGACRENPPATLQALRRNPRRIQTWRMRRLPDKRRICVILNRASSRRRLPSGRHSRMKETAWLRCGSQPRVSLQRLSASVSSACAISSPKLTAVETDSAKVELAEAYVKLLGSISCSTRRRRLADSCMEVQ